MPESAGDLLFASKFRRERNGSTTAILSRTLAPGLKLETFPALDRAEASTDNRPFFRVKANELYQQLDPAVVAEMFTTFREDERDVYKSAVASLAQARKLRPVYVQKKPVPEQIEWMHKTLKLRGSELIGEHLLQVWFMKFHQPLLVSFCDSMGIAHNGEGSVEGALPEELDSAKLSETIDSLFANHNPKLVSLYLHVFNMQTPGGWETLTAILENDDRITLGAGDETANESSEPQDTAPDELPAGESDADDSPATEEDAGGGEEE